MTIAIARSGHLARAIRVVGVALLFALTDATASAPSAAQRVGSVRRPAAVLPPVTPSRVRTSGRQLLVSQPLPDGSLGAEAPYTIRGVLWSPASTTTNTSPGDPNNANVRRPEFGIWAAQDIPLMAAMHVNTVRLVIDPGVDPALGPIGLSVLDALYQQGIMVIMTVDDGINSLTRIADAVTYYKDHPAILMWSLGSEWNINRYFGVFPTAQAAAAATEVAAALVKQLDPDHPVATSYGDIDSNLQSFVQSTVPSVDVWSLNVYRGNTFDNASGSVFDQWAEMSDKPMFLGEFGVDAFHARCLSVPPTGAVNEAEQSTWVLDLWNDIARNLSAVSPDNAALGGTVFSWNDEWWKVSPPGSQETSGWTSDGFPDWHAAEDYWGVVDIARVPRQVFSALAAAFDPAYQPPAHTTTFRAISRGALVCGHQADFRRDGWTFYQRFGGAGGGRGFNVAVADATTGALIDPGTNFDTWASDVAKLDLVSYLSAVPSGRVVMLAVADEAGINWAAQPCELKQQAATMALVGALEALGSQQIRSYCWRGSWAMVVIKGISAPLAEDVQPTEEARAEASVQTAEPPTTAADRYLNHDAGVALHVAAPGVLANDGSNGGGTMTATLVQGPAHGTVTLDPSGAFDYIAAPGYVGRDSFTYRASNTAGVGTLATVTIRVGTHGPMPPRSPGGPTSILPRPVRHRLPR
jgi:Interleukin-like EMT inducer/Bacterial Ig domain/Glycosyl hydrolases family 2, TIM barrel domain